ncbi:SDR family oxidoreductase [Caproiciproducens sp. NJN-50]|uniref:SDR family oxidoreductase n=1 Tax=Acutalibacteraceae TaxID=3082771 RepID=UPI000FFE32CF|nr:MULTISPECIES: SDR family oxidoreductase [Acutalibacteraceae]QAT48439.1 SDR family oxidoreductase [Caproiciproducens sp. NJN-50]
MKVLFIGGTGVISASAASLAAARGDQVTLLTRGSHPELAPSGAELLKADISDEEEMERLLSGRIFDAVADFTVLKPEQAMRDISLFTGKTRQFLFISSASAYQKPPVRYPITESTPLRNPFWRYSRDKIACEELFTTAYRSHGFPVTIVRPSHTYCDRKVPLPFFGGKGGWQVLSRIRLGKPVIVHGDGLTLWTFTHADDFAKGFCGLLGNPHAIGEAVHITSDEAITWNDALESIGTALGVKPNLVHIPSDFLAAFDPELLGKLLGDKAYCAVFDNSKIKRLVPGFSAGIRFADGVRSSVEYYLSHPEMQVPDPEFDAWCDRVIAAHFAGIKNAQNS